MAGGYIGAAVGGLFAGGLVGTYLGSSSCDDENEALKSTIAELGRDKVEQLQKKETRWKQFTNAMKPKEEGWFSGGGKRTKKRTKRKRTKRRKPRTRKRTTKRTRRRR